jgi:hypothetical protein
MVLRLTTTWKEESRVIPPGCKTTKPQKGKSRPNSKGKKWAKSRVLQTYPLKEILSSRFGCSGIKHEYFHLRKPFPTRVSFLPLYNAPTEFHMTGCLASRWFASLEPFPSKSYLIWYSDSNPFMSADLSGAINYFDRTMCLAHKSEGGSSRTCHDGVQYE